MHLKVMHNYLLKLRRKNNYCKTQDKGKMIEKKNDRKTRFGMTANL